MVVSMSIGYILMYLPLLFAVSFAVGASRHEKVPLILDQALRTGAWITSFMFAIYVILQIISWMV